MKLYYEPSSTTCRPIMLFAAEQEIALDYHYVDLMRGEHLQPPYAELNPNKAVPLLVDGDFRLTECSAILKYLADLSGSPAYPADLRMRARVNAAMDWFNTGFYRDFGYGLVYPAAFPDRLALPDPAARALQAESGRRRSERWLSILDRHMLGGEREFVCGPGPTLADYLGAAYVTVGDWIGFDFSAWPNVERWIARMRARPALRPQFVAHDAHAAAMRERIAGRAAA